MERNKDAYINFVCPFCWDTLDKCTCESFPSYHLVFIDRGIQEHIRTLNKKKYNTIGCCEGHTEICMSTYIAFAIDYFDGKNIEMPVGFKYNKKRRTVYHDYPKNISEKELEKEKRKYLLALLEWCNKLPIAEN